jgi:hypothetical protein
MEAAERLARDGPNVVVPERPGRRIKRIVGPLADPMVALLWLAAPTYLLIGETTDAIVAFVALGPIAASAGSSWAWTDRRRRRQRCGGRSRRRDCATAALVTVHAHPSLGPGGPFSAARMDPAALHRAARRALDAHSDLPATSSARTSS